MRRIISIVLLLTVLIGTVGCSNTSVDAEADKNAPASSVGKINTNDVEIYFNANSNGYFYQIDNSSSTRLYYIKGVNIGLSEPDSDLAGPDTSYETYYEWFESIRDMNANTIRVYSVMNPNFYSALYDFNHESNTTLYLMQGIWFSEDLLELNDALESDHILLDAFYRSIAETLDIIHGNSSYTSYGSFNPAIYDKDISPYVVGYILGLEYPASFVIETNASHLDEAQWDGEYLKTTENSTPFESFLCRVGDKLISEETTRYSTQTPVAFLNWQTLDTLTHSNEPYAEEEDAVSVNTENIVAKEGYAAGLFAAFDAYPYYPEYMSHQAEYVEYKNSSGVSDNYAAYLNELKNEYSVPLLIAEYGLSTSRGIGHEGINGYSQGGMTEEEQGKYVVQMAQDIYDSGCCGGLIFNWQDEWFKRTWNMNMYYPDNPTERTQNLSSAEQSYGLLQFVASTNYPDGDVNDWKGVAPISKNLSVKFDSVYMYVLVSLPEGYNFNEDTCYIPISINGTGSTKSNRYNLSFTEGTDYIIVVNGENNTRVLCDAYNDVFHYKYAYLRGVFGESKKFTYSKNSGEYNEIYAYISNEMYLPEDDILIEPQYYEDGLLKYGNGNPSSNEYNSQADFCYKDGKLELRIPWYLIGVMNPKTSVSIAELSGEQIEYCTFESIKIGFGVDGEIVLVDSKFESTKETYVGSRLKNSYYIIQDYFKTFKAN